MGNKKATSVVKNAIDYIEESSLFKNDKYNWIVQLVRLVLDDSFQESDANDLVDTFLSRKNKNKKKIQVPKLQDNLLVKSTTSTKGVKKIKSINKLDNVGLVTLEEPFNFKDGLNVFFGKNGAGKSTLYMGICKALGHSKKVFPNVNFNDDESCCELTYDGVDGQEHKTKWDASNEPDKILKVKIFDSLISNYIVRQSQENKFETAHLKIEYFSKLYDLYDLLEEKIRTELNVVNSNKIGSKNLIQSKAPFLFENEKLKIEKKQLDELVYLKKNEKALVDIDSKIKLLEKGTADLIIKNIENASEEVKKILDYFGELVEVEAGGQNSVLKWKLDFNKKYFDELNKKIKQHKTTKGVIKKQGKNKISSSLPEGWLNSSVWETFIKSSIEFLNTLDDEAKTEFSKEKCIYCKQQLKTDESKRLIEAYRELSHDLKDKLEVLESELNSASSYMDSITELLDCISESNNNIIDEFEHIKKDKQLLNSVDFDSLKTDFKGFAKDINNDSEIVYDKFLLRIKVLWEIYADIYDSFQKKLLSLKNNIQNKATKLDEYNKKASPLREKRDTFALKDEILKYLNLKKQHSFLTTKIEEISTARQLTSKIKTSFTSKETLNEFKQALSDEYELFDFSMPSLWDIKPITRDGVNKRIYSIGDKQLAEIFSEGEQKVHSLSDFFAQSRLEKYEGVYIFDDPVNSLDEDNIESVASRINKLVSDGNQVIIFTHNLYFLNSLIDPSKQKLNELECNNNQITLFRNINIDDDLKKRIQKIKESLQSINESAPDELDMRNIYDLISGYLESYIEKKLFNNIVSRYRPNLRVGSLANLKPIDEDTITKLSTFYNKTSRMGSRHSSIPMTKNPSYSELKADIEALEKEYKK